MYLLNKYTKCNFRGQRCGTTTIVDIRRQKVNININILLLANYAVKSGRSFPIFQSYITSKQVPSQCNYKFLYQAVCSQ